MDQFYNEDLFRKYAQDRGYVVNDKKEDDIVTKSSRFLKSIFNK
jgi:hypothetical protein